MPEPGILGLLALGMLGLAATTRRRKVLHWGQRYFAGKKASDEAFFHADLFRYANFFGNL